MTDAEKKLCRDIAVLEGWRLSPYIDKEGNPSGYRSDNLDSEALPRYLTDPAETVRMLAEIRRCSTKHEWEKFSQDLWLRNAIPIPTAVAERYKAMLEEMANA